MNVVDSSGWIEFFSGAAGADFFAEPIKSQAELLVPTLCFYEVYRHILRERGEESAQAAAARMQTGKVVDLTLDLALSAAALGHDLKLAMADCVMLAVARAHRATLWTQDADFKGLNGVRYRAKS